MKSTVAKNATVQIESGREVVRNIEYYNLDAIISVGYRVNSKRGTQFRQWATQRLKDHLVKGYTLNEKRLQQVAQNMYELEQAVNWSGKKIQEIFSQHGFNVFPNAYTHCPQCF
jgi:hypothetical protein